MATITANPVVKGSPVIESRPVLRMSPGTGCDLEGCNCSPGYWLAVSDGEVWLSVEFDSAEEFFATLTSHGTTELFLDKA